MSIEIIQSTNKNISNVGCYSFSLKPLKIEERVFKVFPVKYSTHFKLIFIHNPEINYEHWNHSIHKTEVLKNVGCYYVCLKPLEKEERVFKVFPEKYSTHFKWVFIHDPEINFSALKPLNAETI